MRIRYSVLLLSALLAIGCSKKVEQEVKQSEQLAETVDANSDVQGAVLEAVKEQPVLQEIGINVPDVSLPVEPVEVPKPELPAPTPTPIATEQVHPPEPAKPAAPLPKIPANAEKLMPDVIAAIDEVWPDMPMRSYFPAQIEAESCITLTHSKCWNPRAELKTSREYGFGLGQITIAYRADGSERFNVFNEVKTQHPSLRNWAWEDRYNPRMQIMAIVVKNKVNWGAIKWPVADLDNRMAFLATFYNGGNPIKDRNLCVNTAGCDPSRWWGNVEKYSIKSKTPLKEYGNRSLFQISREYPRKVLIERRPKYVPYTGT